MDKPNLEVKVISSSTESRPDSCVLELVEVLQVGDRRLLLTITASDYRSNVCARVKVWTDAGWTFVHSIPPPHVKSSHRTAQFDADRAELLRVAAAVLDL